MCPRVSVPRQRRGGFQLDRLDIVGDEGRQRIGRLPVVERPERPGDGRADLGVGVVHPVDQRAEILGASTSFDAAHGYDALPWVGIGERREHTIPAILTAPQECEVKGNAADDGRERFQPSSPTERRKAATSETLNRRFSPAGRSPSATDP